MTQTLTTTQVVPLDVRKLAGDVLLLAWTSDDAASRGVRATVYGELVRPPASHTVVPLGAGRVRNLMAVRVALAAGAPISVCDSAGHTLAETDSRAHNRSRTPDLDPAGLLAGLDGAARVRVIRFLTDVCGSIFQLGANAEFIANCQHLIGEISRRPGVLVPRCTVLDRHVLCTGLVKPAIGERLSAIIVGPGGVRRAGHAPVVIREITTRQGLATFAVLLDKAAATAGTSVIVLGDNGMACRQVADMPATTSSLDFLLTARADTAPVRRYLTDCLARSSAQDPHAASLLRELHVLSPQRGRVVNETACPVSAGADLMLATPAGMFVSGWLRDQHGVVEAIEIARSEHAVRVPVDRLIRFPHREADLRRTVAASDVYSGFATFVASPDLRDASCKMMLRLRSGGRLALADGPSFMTVAEARDAVLSAIPADHVPASTIAACIEPVLAALRAAQGEKRREATIVDIGAMPEAPVASLVVPLSNEADIVRCRIGMFATDPAMAGVEIIHVMDEMQHRAGGERLLRAMHAAYGIPMRLVVVEERCDSGSALNAAVRTATAPLLAFLGRCVLPENANWLTALAGFLDAHPRCGMVGSRMMREDHSIASAGAEFAVNADGDWDVKALYQGFPCDFAAAAAAGPVAALAFGCFMVRRSLFEMANGFDETYFGTLRQGADFSARVRSHGFEVWRAAEPMLFDLTTEDRQAASDVCAELDRRVLEQSWRQAITGSEPAQTGAVESQPAKPRARARRRRRAA